MGFAGGSVVKNPPASAGNAGDMGLIAGSGRSPGVGNSTYSIILAWENPMDRGAWWATVYGIAKSQTQRSTHAYIDMHDYMSLYIFCQITYYTKSWFFHLTMYAVVLSIFLFLIFKIPASVTLTMFNYSVMNQWMSDFITVSNSFWTWNSPTNTFSPCLKHHLQYASFCL